MSTTTRYVMCCQVCGCELHQAVSASGVQYWASHSGNGFCPWPADYNRHEPGAASFKEEA